MDSEEQSSSTLVDTELERLREKVSEPPDVETIVQDLIKKSASIHVSHLFSPVGAALRKKLCLLLSATKPSTLYAGWEDFGNQLNLDNPLIQCIKYNFTHEDPTSNVLLAYAQNDSATLSNVIQAVYDMKRHDIILRVEEEFAETCRSVLETKNIYYNRNKYVALQKTPNCPFIFKDISKMCRKFESEEAKIRRVFEEIPRHPRFEFERLKTAAPVAQRKNYAKTAMLTFTADANKIVEGLVPQLREPKHGKRLGVLVLGEQMKRLDLNPEQFIFECFSQVDYVIPVITPEYVRAINSSTSGIEEDMLHVDNKYVKYIYTLISSHYVMNGCRNFKVRGLVPDDSLFLVHTSRLMEHPLLQIWFKLSDAAAIVTKLLDGDI